MSGEVIRQFKNPTETSVTRVNKNGKTVHEEHYDYINGLMTGITTKDSDFGRFWVIDLYDGNEKQVLQLNYSSGYANAFLKTLPNVDLTKEITIVPKESVDDKGKKKATLFITQGGKALKWYYTQENKNGLPDLIIKEGKGKDKGKKIYDDSEVMEFLEDMVNDEIVPNLPTPKEALIRENSSASEKDAEWKPVEEDEEEETTDEDTQAFNKRMGDKNPKAKAAVASSAKASSGKKSQQPVKKSAPGKKGKAF